MYFDGCYFDPAYFAAAPCPTSGGGRRYRPWWDIPIIEEEPDDEALIIALTL